jgi:hypothetical protein
MPRTSFHNEESARGCWRLVGAQVDREGLRTTYVYVDSGAGMPHAMDILHVSGRTDFVYDGEGNRIEGGAMRSIRHPAL